MRQQKDKYFCIPIAVFERNIFVYSGKEKGCIDFLGKNGIFGYSEEQLKERMSDGVEACTIMFSNGNSCIFSEKSFKNSLDLLVHELCHAVNHILNYMEIHEVAPYNETFAYLMQFCFKECQKNLKKKH